MNKVNDTPDWLYLLREFDNIYRRGSAGGSSVIRRHQRVVRERLSHALKSNPELVLQEHCEKPVLAHLGRALDAAYGGPMAPMARVIERLKGTMNWEWGYERLSNDLSKRYAYTELLGPKGSVVSDTLILGLVLFAPRTTYPQHSHADIEESYVSISGAWSENDAAVYAPGSLILNRPGHEHRITIGDRKPCFLAFAWVEPPDRLAQPAMKFAKQPRRISDC
ncbi:MAG: dimethlysulfonioproprionate lyase DddL [Rhodospirillaceae bacterium]|nr:dimethlysulfonioproprionate lyase DddL [Rhodospirillaceae bacterium]